MTFQAFDAYVDTHAPAILDRLAAFCRIPSVSAENGSAMGQAADFVTGYCREIGVHTELFAKYMSRLLTTLPPSILCRASPKGMKRLSLGSSTRMLRSAR